MATVRRAIDAVYPALEIIETRGDFTAQIALAMADNAQQKTIVLGNPVPLGALALDAVAATVRINGETVATGRGDAVLGNPLNSVIWLARKLQRVRPRHPARRDHHERLVHAAIPDRARRSGAGGFWRRGGGAGGNAGVARGRR